MIFKASKPGPGVPAVPIVTKCKECNGIGKIRWEDKRGAKAVIINCTKSLKEVLARMDAAAVSFRGVTAQVRKVSLTAVIKDEAVETGGMSMARLGSKELRVKIDFTEPDPRSVALSGRKAEIYYPKINTVHEYDLGKQRGLVGGRFGHGGFGHARLCVGKSLVVISGTNTGRWNLHGHRRWRGPGHGLGGETRPGRGP